jgi:hypothetical protein
MGVGCTKNPFSDHRKRLKNKALSFERAPSEPHSLGLNQLKFRCTDNGNPMASPTPLHDSELLDCVIANSKSGITVAAQNCGYGDDLERFQIELQKAGDAIGVDIQQFTDLNHLSRRESGQAGIEIAPETPNQL